MILIWILSNVQHTYYQSSLNHTPTFAYSMPGTKFYIASPEYREEVMEILSSSDEQDIVYDYM